MYSTSFGGRLSPSAKVAYSSHIYQLSGCEVCWGSRNRAEPTVMPDSASLLGLFVMLCLLYFLYCKDIFFGMFLYYMYYGKLYPNYRADVL